MAIELVEISDDQVALLIKTQEGHFLDFKAVEISPSSATKTVSAFANAAGGELFIGVDEVLGQSGFERRWRGFANQEAANGLIQTLEGLSPLGNHYQLEFLRNGNQSGLVAHITVFKGRDILPASSSRIFVRRGAQGLPVEGEDALKRLKYDKGLSSFEDELVDVEIVEIANSETVIDFMLNVVPAAEPET